MAPSFVQISERQDYRGRDLRERLDRMRSPLRKYSPGRDARARYPSHGDSPHSRGKSIERNHRKRQQLDGNSDYSGSLRMSDGTEDQIADRRHASSDMRIDEKLRQMHYEIKMLDNDKRQMEMYLGDKVQEADNLRLKIHELEMHISEEKEQGKRSHAQLQKLGEQLYLDAADEDDSKTNIAINDETGGTYSISPLHELQTNSPRKKRTRLEVHDSSNQANPVNAERTEIGNNRLEKLSRQTGHHDQWTNSKKSEADGEANNGNEQLSHGDKSRRGKNLPPDIALADKYKVSEPAITVPPTGIAAHAMDEEVEVVEMEEKSRVTGAISSGAETEVTLKTPRLPFLPPPPPLPVPHNVYQQYKGDDENVDINGHDEETWEVEFV
ncbi:hypothetical protein ACJIZ3_010838 [Penstemon smallii]|uniref:Zinc finger CCCH domain-containing protein 13 n=1 Tax=Penstemon smallii TaxID=265156 RepID=A0ABD3UJL4_9LAMI